MTANDVSLVELARHGDRDSLACLLEQLRVPLFRIATAMLWDRDDAEDATQEALIAVMTNLSTFRGDASLSTWAHRIAVRLYMRRRGSPTERAELTFDSFALDLLDGLTSGDTNQPDAELLAEEVRVGCTLAVLQCLNREDRVVFALGDVLGLAGDTAAEILGVSHDTYRKRLSRVRQRIRTFVSAHCGLVESSAECRCTRRVDVAVARGRIDPARLRFVDPTTVERAKHQIQDLHDAAALFRAAGTFEPPDSMTTRVMALIEQGNGPLFDEVGPGNT